MFIYSSDPVEQRKQEIDDDKTLHLIEKYCNVEHYQEIEDFFDKNCNSISYLIDFVTTMRTGFRFHVTCVDRTEMSTTVRGELDKGFGLTSKYTYDYIPFIRFTFMEMQKINGTYMQELYMIFFTKNSKFKDAEAATLYYLNKFHKMKAFT